MAFQSFLKGTRLKHVFQIAHESCCELQIDSERFVRPPPPNFNVRDEPLVVGWGWVPHSFPETLNLGGGGGGGRSGPGDSNEEKKI